MEINPIINLNLTELPNTKQGLLDIYSNYLAERITDYKQIGVVELSLASSALLEILPEIYNILRNYNLQVSFGSIVDLDLVLALQDLKLPAGIRIFAPAFDEDVFRFVIEQDWHYIPGVACVEDFKEVLSWMPNLMSVKVFPVYNLSLLKTLATPYPELRLPANITRTSSVTGLPISSPRQYQKIRQRFLHELDLELSFQTRQFDIPTLLATIKQQSPATKLIATGFAGIEPDEELLASWGFDAAATRLGSLRG